MKRVELGVSACAVFAIIGLGCQSPTEITVVVDTTLDCALITSTAIAVGSKDALVAKSAAATTLHCDGGHIGALVVVPSGDSQDEVAIRIVSGLKGQTAEACTKADYLGGCIVARRSLHFVSHTPLRVPITMAPTCIDVACDAPGSFATCVNGACVSAVIPDPGACTGDGCGDGVLGDAGTGANDGGPDATTPDSGDASDGGREGGGGDAGTDGSVDASIEGGSSGPTWVPMASSSTVGFLPRTQVQMVWTGSRMMTWGGALQTSYADDGATYDPATDTWELLPASQTTARTLNALVWTGSELLVWGGAPIGVNATRYTPATGTWHLLPDAPIAARANPAFAWADTTKEMLVWGGESDTDFFADGAAYSPTRPAGSEWRVIAPSPLTKRTQMKGVWNGTSLMIFGGRDGNGTLDDAAFYDPAQNVWTAVTNVPAILDSRIVAAGVATGPTLTSATFFGSAYSGALRTTGATYDAAHNLWSPIDGLGTNILAKPARDYAAFFWGAGKFYMWGGYADDIETTTTGDGASFDPSAGAGGTWTAMAAGGPSPRAEMGVVWTGTEAIIWGGDTADGTVLDDGKIFRP